MTGLQMAILAGMLVAAGLVLAVRALRPGPPALTAALKQLSAAAPAVAAVAAPAGGGRVGWLPERVTAALEGRIKVADADLKIIGWTRSQLAARKVTLALTGLLAPAFLAALLALVGLGGFAVFPVFLGLGVAGVLWWLPTQEVAERAEAARIEFRANLEFFLTLVAGERRARGSVEQALEEAVEVSESAAFVAMRRAIRRAMFAGHKPWRDLYTLGEELNVPELRSLAEIAEVAADGASVYNTLLTTARTLRHEELSAARTEANKASERMARPLGLLLYGMAAFIVIPFALHAFGAG
jgi:tight adherence protein C